MYRAHEAASEIHVPQGHALGGPTNKGGWVRASSFPAVDGAHVVAEGEILHALAEIVGIADSDFSIGGIRTDQIAIVIRNVVERMPPWERWVEFHLEG